MDKFEITSINNRRRTFWLSTAVQAVKDGAEVILLEKSAYVSGAANMRMGPLGIGTSYQKHQMYDVTVEKAFTMFMEYTHYNVDARQDILRTGHGWIYWILRKNTRN